MTIEGETIYPRAAEESDHRPDGGVGWSWRRVVGVVTMGVGALLIMCFLALAIVVALTFVEWRSAFDGLSSVGLVSLPPIFVGAALLALGRWIYGGWRANAPISFAASVILQVAGVVAAFAAIVLLFIALFAETGRGGAWVVSQFAVSVVLSLALVVLGLLLRRRRARA